MAAEGVVVDRAAANLAVGRWLREVANARVHATTREVPAARLEVERGALRPVPPPYGGLIPRTATAAPPPAARPVVGLQHPLALYDALFAAPAMPEAMA
jgi:hypothetical protein